MSQGRPAVSPVNSSQTAPASSNWNPEKPIAWPNRARICQSGRAVPGGSTTCSLKETSRSLLVMVPVFSAPHRVRLAGEAEWPRARLADLPGQQVEVDDAVVLPHADGALVQPLAVKRQQRARACEPVGQRADERLRDARGRDQLFP